MGWTEVRDAIQGAVVRASGLAADKVIWKPLNAGSPPLNYVALGLSGLMTHGIDYILSSTDLGRPDGEQIKLEVKGDREVILEIECFTASTADSSDALALAEKIRTSFTLPSIQALLDAADVSPFDFPPVDYAPDVPNTTFRGRSMARIHCYVPPEAVFEYTTWIESVSGIVTVSGSTPDPKYVAFDTGEPDDQVLFGVAIDPGSYDTAFLETIAGQGSATAYSPARHVDFEAGAGEYCFYIVPASFPAVAATTTANGSVAGFSIVATVNRILNPTTLLPYVILRSDVAGLGTWGVDFAEAP